MKDEALVTPLGGIILAGGASKRMGRDKAGLPWQGATILENLCDSLRTLSPLIIVGPFTRQMTPLHSDIQVVYDAIPFAGPLAGLAQGLQSFPESAQVFVTGCDYPRMSIQLAEQLQQGLQQADAVVLTHQGIRQPLPGVYRAAILPGVKQLLDRGEASLQALLDSIITNQLSESVWQAWPSVSSHLTHFNSWDEYQHAANLTSTASSSIQPEHPGQQTGEQPPPR